MCQEGLSGQKIDPVECHMSVYLQNKVYYGKSINMTLAEFLPSPPLFHPKKWIVWLRESLYLRV